MVVQHVKIVKVAAHFFRRGHGGKQVKAFVLGNLPEITRQHSFLDIRSYGKLGSDPFLFCGNLGKGLYVFLQVAGHIVDAVRQ